MTRFGDKWQEEEKKEWKIYLGLFNFLTEDFMGVQEEKMNYKKK